MVKKEIQEKISKAVADAAHDLRNELNALAINEHLDIEVQVIDRCLIGSEALQILVVVSEGEKT